MASRSELEVEVRYLDERAGWVIGPLSGVNSSAVVQGRPVRSFPTYIGQRNYPGLLWSATTGTLLGYESLLERDRLLLADFDPKVTAIASQPFWICGRDGRELRRHVPDFLLRTDVAFVVVDVKPEPLLDEPDLAAVLDWAGRAFAAKGWAFEVWSGANPVLLRNVRFLAAARRAETVDDNVLGKVAASLRPGMSVADAERASQIDHRLARGAVLALLWRGDWATDLTRPLSGESVLTAAGRAA